MNTRPMTRSLFIFALIGLIAFALTVKAASLAPSNPTVYEGFNYSSGAVDGSTQNGGTGMSGAWSTSTTDGGTLYSMVSGGLTFNGATEGSLVTGGSVRAKRSTAPGGAEMNRAITTVSQGALTADNTSVWFSVLVNTERFSAGNENGTFVLGTGALDVNTPDGVLPSITGGEGVGLHIDGLNSGGSPFYIHAYAIDGGTSAKSGAYLDTGTTAGVYLIAGRMDWAPNGSDDTISLFNITDTVALASLSGGPATPFATITADVDQTLFDTLAIANRQVSSLDEIRFGLTFADVVPGLATIPEPSTIILAGLGLLGLAFRRRNRK
ncbi:MAG: PEP-CTERM sorting domain-containing protein [Lentisphaeria bacterium]|nr:PEP-CTERM sorting domain-containing protein [Lentisphaeria bacterium]